MKRSTRLFRNTVLALAGLVVLYVIASRFFAVDETPVAKQSTSVAELATLRDFSSISVSGNFDVEVVQQAQYSVEVTPAPEGRYHINVVDHMLNLRGMGRAQAIHVRVGMPALVQLKANEHPALTVTGFSGDSVDLRLGEVSRVVLRNNSVRQWQIFAADAGELQIDRASMDAGKVNLFGRASLTVID